MRKYSIHINLLEIQQKLSLIPLIRPIYETMNEYGRKKNCMLKISLLGCYEILKKAMELAAI